MSERLWSRETMHRPCIRLQAQFRTITAVSNSAVRHRGEDLSGAASPIDLESPDLSGILGLMYRIRDTC